MAPFVDDLGRSVEIPSPPRRIASLCPSVTETLFALGVGERVVGRTHFCVHPQPQINQVARIGGTKNVKIDRLRATDPELVVAVKEENERATVEALAQDYPVVVFDVTDRESALSMIRRLGSLVGSAPAGEAMARSIASDFHGLPQFSPSTSVAYLIWQEQEEGREPTYMLVGHDTFIHAMLTELGLENICAPDAGRYPTLSRSQLLDRRPDFIWLSSEPYPFREKHLQSWAATHPNADIRLVDGEIFSWYGARMQHFLPYVNKLRKKIYAET